MVKTQRQRNHDRYDTVTVDMRVAEINDYRTSVLPILVELFPIQRHDIINMALANTPRARVILEPLNILYKPEYMSIFRNY